MNKPTAGRHRVVAGEWTKIYDPSLGESEPWYVNDHTFFQGLDGTWHLIGITRQEPWRPEDEVDLCHATAPSLLGPWTKQPPALTADPAWGERHLWAPHVITHDDTHWMFVCGGSLEGGDTYRLHLATSDDGFNWTRHPENPLVVDGFHARDPMVLRLDDRWVMYYTATSEPAGGHHNVVVAESDDLVHWSGRHVVYEDALQGTGGGPTESPYVVQRNGTWYLFIGPYEIGGAMAAAANGERYDWTSAYSSTVVLASDEPMHFDAANQVGAITAHAAEVVTDEDGRDWISHAGWNQGGVYLAPLDFQGAADSPKSPNPFARRMTGK